MLLLLSDAAAYMKSAGEMLKIIPRIYHVLPDLINDLERDDCTMLEWYRKM